ncbi:hypothetical protein MXL54_00025 [Enterobacteriaceae bacterium G50]|nr:hypothetical protein [Enterobacteriaceae bacterium G50]
MMNQDALLIAQSISELKQNSDVFKDYFFPIVMSFFSAFLGGVSAYYFNQRQEKNKFEKENFIVATKVLTTILSALNDLVAIKSNYHDLKSKDPIARALAFPAVILGDSKLTIDLSSLSFIKNVPTANKKTHIKFMDFILYKMLRLKKIKPSSEEIQKTWRNYSRLSACVSNYNYIMELLKVRFTVDNEIKARLSAKHDELTSEANAGRMMLSSEVIRSSIDKNTFIKYIDLSEMLIALIDNVLKELDSFVTEFPSIAESNIELSKVGRGVRLVIVKNDRPLYLSCIKAIDKPDFELVSQITGMNTEEIRRRYTFSDWY